MQTKQKVTLYLPPELHRQLKIRAAIDIESMSTMVEKAIAFYLDHPEKVEEVDAIANNIHQVHTCPECETALVIREGRMTSLKDQPSIVTEELPIGVRSQVDTQADSQGEEELVPC